MIPEYQRELIDSNTNIAKVLRVLADAIEPMRQRDIMHATNLTRSETNSAIIRIQRAKYCDLKITGTRTVKKYVLLRMKCPISEYQKATRWLKYSTDGGLKFDTRRSVTSILDSVFN